MLRNGLRLGGLEARLGGRLARERREPVGAEREAGERPAEVGAARRAQREWSAFDHSTCSSTKCSSYSATAMSSPRFETIRPRSIGYSPGSASATSS